MSFSFVNPQNGLWRDAKIAKTHSRILDKIMSLPVEVRKEKFNMELLTMICCCIENSIDNTDKKPKMKIDKKDICIKVLVSLFTSISPNDIETISKNIEYLHDNGKIVKFSKWYIIGSTVIDWLKKKVKQ
jgi:hypothetical protein